MNSDRQLETLIGRILLAEERGEPLDREALLGEHPQLADELRAFLADHDAWKPGGRGKPPSDSPPSGEPPLDASTLDGWTRSAAGGEGRPPGGAVFGEAEFGDYELLEELGRGGMGVVYRARRRSLGKTVALKTLLPGALHDPSAVQRFYAEAESAARLEHPGIVPVFDVGEHQGRHFYSMALVEGATLSARIAAGPLPPQEAAELVRRAALAVEHAHRNGVIHRDIKPANILIDSAGEPRITDFGLAKKTDDQLELTQSGQILGTLAYMAPEQAAGRRDEITAAVDVYALGAVLYTALAGRPPFQGESHAELLVKVLTQDPPTPHSPHGRCPQLVRICQKCLEKDPRNRYESAQSLAEDLDRCLRDEPLQAAAADWPQRVRKWIRRQPSLAAHLLGLGSVELLRHTKHFWSQDTWLQDVRIGGTILLWIAACFVMQRLVDRVGDTARYLWSIVDLVLLTWVLSLIEDPYGPLLATYPLAIVFGGLLFRVRLVVITTLGAAACYLALLVLRPADAPPHHHLLFVLLLLLFGIVIGTHLRRLRLLEQVYSRRRE